MVHSAIKQHASKVQRAEAADVLTVSLAWAMTDQKAGISPFDTRSPATRAQVATPIVPSVSITTNTIIESLPNLCRLQAK